MVHVGEGQGMSFYIGPSEKGFVAQVTVEGKKQEQTFKVFNQAVKWVEQLKKEELKQNEIERSKEENP